MVPGMLGDLPHGPIAPSDIPGKQGGIFSDPLLQQQGLLLTLRLATAPVLFLILNAKPELIFSVYLLIKFVF